MRAAPGPQSRAVAGLVVGVALLALACAPPEIEYGDCNAIALPPLPGHQRAEAWGLNQLDPPVVVGTSSGGGEERAVVWTFDASWTPSVRALPFPKEGEGNAQSLARDVNDDGTIVGAVQVEGGEYEPVVWSGDEAQRIAVPGAGRGGIATAVSESGAVAGWIGRMYARIPPQPRHPYRGFLVPDDGGRSVIGIRLNGVTDAGGEVFAAGDRGPVGSTFPETPLVIGSNGYWRELGTELGRAHDLVEVSADGQRAFFVGGTQRNEAGTLTATTWTDFGIPGPELIRRRLEVPASATFSVAQAVNRARQAVGFVRSGPDLLAFRWDADGAGRDLNEELWPACEGRLTQALGVNEAGRIVGRWERGAGSAGFLLDPASVALRPRVSVRKTGPDAIGWLEPLVYRFQLANQDSVDREVTLSDDLPHDVALAAASLDPVDAHAGACARSAWSAVSAAAGGKTVATEVTVPAQGACTVLLELRVESPLGSVVNRREDYRVRVGDAEAVNGETEVATEILPPPPPPAKWEVELEKTGPDRALRTEVITLRFTVRVERRGEDPLDLHDELPPGLRLASGDWTDAGDGTVFREVEVAPGESEVSVSLPVEVDRDAALGEVVNETCWLEAAGERLAECGPHALEVANHPPAAAFVQPSEDCEVVQEEDFLQLVVGVLDPDDDLDSLDIEVRDRGEAVEPQGPPARVGQIHYLRLAGLPPGEHCFTLTVRDPAGGESAPAYRCIRVGTAPQRYAVTALPLPAGGESSRALDLDASGLVGGSADGHPCRWSGVDDAVECLPGFDGEVIDLDEGGLSPLFHTDTGEAYLWDSPPTSTASPQFAPLDVWFARRSDANARSAIAWSSAFSVFAYARLTAGSFPFLHPFAPPATPPCLPTGHFDLNGSGSAAGSFSACGPTRVVFWDARVPGERAVPSDAFLAALNERHHLAGWQEKADGSTRAARWLASASPNLGAPEDLHAFGDSSRAWEIDDFARVVGYATLPGPPPQPGEPAPVEHRAFLHACEGTVDLNERVPASAGWVLEEARAINDAGQIVGFGQYGGETRAFRLRPAP
jgi:hypothetical protein